MSPPLSVPLSRSLTAAELSPGQWCNDLLRHISGLMCVITVCCPICANKTSLTEQHIIESDGKVQPAFACSACPFFEHVVLEGYGQPVF